MNQLVVKLMAVAVMVCSICLLTLPIAQAASDFTWCNKMSDMLRSFEAGYPGSDFGPYFEKQTGLREATERGDNIALRAEITGMIKMARRSEIDHDAAVELVNYLYVWRSTLATQGPYQSYARSK